MSTAKPIPPPAPNVPLEERIEFSNKRI